MGKMVRGKPPGKEKKIQRKQIGVKIDVDLWREIKILALKENRTAGEILEDSLRDYLEKAKT